MLLTPICQYKKIFDHKLMKLFDCSHLDIASKIFQLVTLIFIELFIKASNTACRVYLRDNCAYKSNRLQLDSILFSCTVENKFQCFFIPVSN